MSTDKLVSKSDLQEFYNRILPYLGGSADAGFTPVGTVISVMGKTAPANYLACDGSVYNIADYPELADYFLQQFESKNYFGGDGTTTFAVPDLQGEFLRGAGTNSHENQGNGAEVGEHQDATENRFLQNGSGNNIMISHIATATNYDSIYVKGSTKALIFTGSESGSSSNTYTVRPTNTSVLFCIATKNIYLNPSLDYSTDEKVVGTWIDGSTIFQKTIQTTMPTITTDLTPVDKEITLASIGLTNVENIISLSGFAKNSEHTVNLKFNDCWTSNDNVYFIRVYFANDSLHLAGNRKSSSEYLSFITIQYTKTTD